eukprot:SAG31_NODE_36454_length_313_cov_0.728972_1_plen_59_part_10
MTAMLTKEVASFYSNQERGHDSCPPNIHGSCGCWMAKNKYGGAFGPFQEVSGVPPAPPG